MNRLRISEAIGNIDMRFIDEALEPVSAHSRKGRRLCLRWAALAACAALAALTVVFGGLFKAQSDGGPLAPIVLIEYQNAYLEVIDDPEAARLLGLAAEIPDGAVGEHIAYLTNESPDYGQDVWVETDAATGAELLEYLPASCDAVRVFRQAGRCRYAVFCNYHVPTDRSMPVSAALEVYGVRGPGDIRALYFSKSGQLSGGERGTADAAAIAEFCRLLCALPEHSFASWERSVFGGGPQGAPGTSDEDPAAELYSRVADDCEYIVVETAAGLRLRFGYYPSYGWMSCGITMSYYPVSAELSALLQDLRGR